MEWRSSLCAETGTDSLFSPFSLKTIKNVSSVLSACVGKKNNNPSEYFYKGRVPYVRLNSQGSEEDIPYTNHSQPNINYKSTFMSKMESLNSVTSELMKKARWGTLMAPQIIGGFVGTKSLSGREQPFSIGVFSAPVNFSGVIEVAQTLVNTMCSGKFDPKSNPNLHQSDHNEIHTDANNGSNISENSDLCLNPNDKSLPSTEERTVDQNTGMSFKDLGHKEAESSKVEVCNVPTYASVASKSCFQNSSSGMSLTKISDHPSSKISAVPRSRYFNNRNRVDRKSRGYYKQKGCIKNRHVATENKPMTNKHLHGNWISEPQKQNCPTFPVNNFVYKPYEKSHRKLNGKMPTEMKFIKQDKKTVIEDVCKNNSPTLHLISNVEGIACDINLKDDKDNDICKTNKNSDMGENSKSRRKRRRRKRRQKAYDDRTNEKSQLETKLALDDYDRLKNKTVTNRETSESNSPGTSNPLEMDCLALKLSISPPICANATIAFILGICSDVDSQDTESDFDSDHDDYEENERLWKLLQQSGSRISLPIDEISCSSIINPEEENTKGIDVADCSAKTSFIKCNDEEFDVVQNAPEEDTITGISVASRLQEINHNWNINIGKLDLPHKYKKPTKKVHFAEGKTLCQVHLLVAWAFAYQAARKGDWETYARDRARFALRIKDAEKCISRVLDPVHRCWIYDNFVCGKEKKEDL